jgi:hypothetical protein
MKDKFKHQMEMRWSVLQYCDNHWKTHEITTSNYPQWHKSHCRRPVEDLKKKLGEPAPKKRKTKAEDDMESKNETNTEDCPMPENMDVDEDNTDEGISLSVRHDNLKGSGSSSLMPRVQPLSWRDPL